MGFSPARGSIEMEKWLMVRSNAASIWVIASRDGTPTPRGARPVELALRNALKKSKHRRERPQKNLAQNSRITELIDYFHKLPTNGFPLRRPKGGFLLM
jgi:hypothetical protein